MASNMPDPDRDDDSVDPDPAQSATRPSDATHLPHVEHIWITVQRARHHESATVSSLTTHTSLLVRTNVLSFAVTSHATPLPRPRHTPHDNRHLGPQSKPEMTLRVFRRLRGRRRASPCCDGVRNVHGTWYV